MNMYKYSLFILIILSVSCRNRSTDTSKFSQGQIDSLCLDSTKLIQIDDQAATVIDLNPFLKKKSFDLEKMLRKCILFRLKPGMRVWLQIFIK